MSGVHQPFRYYWMCLIEERKARFIFLTDEIPKNCPYELEHRISVE